MRGMPPLLPHLVESHERGLPSDLQDLTGARVHVHRRVEDLLWGRVGSVGGAAEQVRTVW